jgi:CBS domain-containing protein
MQTIAEVMTHDVAVVSPQDTIRHAAEMMRDWDVGALPVCDGRRLVGMLTDRDITVRAVADGGATEQMRVSEMMTDEVLWCFEDQTVGEVLQQMGDRQIRRIPVVNRDMQLVGIVALGDLATRHHADVEDTLEKISTPSEPNRPGADELRTRRPQSDSAGGRF